jgi:hypothetical protein
MTERGSDRHGPLLDQALAREVDGMLRGTGPTHAEEWRDPEPAGPDQPRVGTAAGADGGTPDGMGQADLELRAELAAVLGRAAFPADGTALRSWLADGNAPDHLRALLARLPGDRRYENVGEVWAALRLPAEDQGF